MFDAAAADRIAVAIEERHREIGFLQPVLVGGFAERRLCQRQQEDETAEAQGCSFRQRLDDDPALPMADIEAVHEGGEALIKFPRAGRRGEQGRIDARIEIQQDMPDSLLPIGGQVVAHQGL